MKRLLVLCGLVALLAVPAAAAGRSKTAATLSYSPNPAFVGDTLVFSGCGYQPGVGVEVLVERSTVTATTEFSVGLIPADANGCFSTAGYGIVLPDAGAWTATSYQGQNMKRPSATITFNVG